MMYFALKVSRYFERQSHAIKIKSAIIDSFLPTTHETTCTESGWIVKINAVVKDEVFSYLKSKNSLYTRMDTAV